MREKLSLSPFWLSAMSQLFSALPSDGHHLPAGSQVPNRGCGEPPACRCSEPCVQRGRGAWHRAGGTTEEWCWGPAGEGGPGPGWGGDGEAPQGQPRAATPRVRPGRGGRGSARSRARQAAAVAAARQPQPCSSQFSAGFSPRCQQVPPGRRQRRREEPEGSSAMGPLRESKVKRSTECERGVRARGRWTERQGGPCGARRGRGELQGWRVETESTGTGRWWGRQRGVWPR